MPAAHDVPLLDPIIEGSLAGETSFAKYRRIVGST
jgi:hypothetical protein